jgi:hypothetical protein
VENHQTLPLGSEVYDIEFQKRDNVQLQGIRPGGGRCRAMTAAEEPELEQGELHIIIQSFVTSAPQLQTIHED